MIQKQRSYICVRTRYGFRKLVWINEDSSGIYVGHYEKTRASHSSYHADGRRHTRVEGEPRPVLLFQGTPIGQITEPIQIVSTAVFLRAGKLMKPGTEYVRDDPKTNAAIFLDVGMLAKESLSASFCIFGRSFEAKFLSSHYKIAEITGRPIVAATSLALRFFPQHKIGIALSGMNELRRDFGSNSNPGI